MQDVQVLYKRLKTQKMTPVEEAVLLLHCCNVQSKLQCLNNETEQKNCQLPDDWKNDTDGVYSFAYKLNSGKNVLFKFVDNTKTINVNLVVEETGLLHETQVEIGEGQKETIQKYLKFLSSTLKVGVTKATTNTTLRPVPLGNDYDHGYIFQQQPQNPSRLMPSGRPLFVGEHVGPDNAIFTGRYPEQTIPDLSRPFGSRYDPTNPFDAGFGPGQMGPGRGRGGNGSDFFSGFDSFGRPNGGGFNPGRFM